MYDIFLYLITRAFTLRVCSDMSDQMDWLLHGAIETDEKTAGWGDANIC
jgi:hypothetical protein